MITSFDFHHSYFTLRAKFDVFLLGIVFQFFLEELKISFEQAVGYGLDRLPARMYNLDAIQPRN